MKNKSAISFFLGLLMLTVIAHQVLNGVIRLSIGDDSIELVELMEDTEENEETEDKVIDLYAFLPENYALKHRKPVVYTSRGASALDVYTKIPVPPPELV